MHGVKTFVIISLAKGCATNNMGLNLPIQIHADLHLCICIDHPAIAMAIITHASMENCHVMGFSIDGKISNRETIRQARSNFLLIRTLWRAYTIPIIRTDIHPEAL